MPFGLTNAPDIFQALINDALRDFLNDFVFVHLDDILIFSWDKKQCESHIRAVLQRLYENQLLVNAEKCDFHVSAVSFLDSIFGKGHFRTDPDKVRAFTNWPIPSDRKQLQRFLGCANFYWRFIKDYSHVADLTHLPSEDLLMDSGGRQSIWWVKGSIFHCSHSVSPWPHKWFIVEVDASDLGVGAVLSQRYELDNKIHPCALFYRRLTSAEQNYDVSNRELLANKLALEEWRH